MSNKYDRYRLFFKKCYLLAQGSVLFSKTYTCLGLFRFKKKKAIKFFRLLWLCINIDTFSPFCKGLHYNIDTFQRKWEESKPI